MKPKEFLKSLPYKLYVDDEVVETMPMDGGVCEFFRLDKYLSDNELQNEYENRGLVPASVFALLSTPQGKLDKMRYVGTHWKDSKGKWCFCTFRRWDDGERSVIVDRNDNDWDDDWWFAGVRKSISPKTSEPKNSPSDTQDLELRVQKLEELVENVRKFLVL